MDCQQRCRHFSAASPTKSAKAKVPPGKAILAGGIAGGIEIMITFPTEYVKTQLQIDQKEGTRLYKGSIDCVRKTINEHGFRGLYRGLDILLYGSIPKSAVRFGAYETAKNLFFPGKERLNKMQSMTCGLTAGMLEAIFAVCPMETIKVRFIDDRRRKLPDKPRFKGFFHGVSLIVKEEGFRGVYKGLVPTMIKQGSNQAVRFVIYNGLMQWLQGADVDKTIGIFPTFICGGTAGACSVLFNTPVDVIKTRMQMNDTHRYRNWWHCATSIYQYEGLRAFYQGIGPRMARVVMDVGLVFVLYSRTIMALNYMFPSWK
ncbi:tricarboxylate transport protein, mitochondrial-like [Sycon ciliatum]|uniref:tricarboxylate transport protein, mitochondrial-like n=1 Tax=Sycon ciliatum TaxID=27933 RepID=UPI0020AE2241|eukprot:scpid52570/ scgid18706/ Tricarboxylate transport protein, mitochondrial; Citrate transport protein; Solute carrier family 25 member 1; Tricarboxylate carrier protein